jgi:hypothetical protein
MEGRHLELGLGAVPLGLLTGQLMFGLWLLTEAMQTLFQYVQCASRIDGPLGPAIASHGYGTNERDMVFSSI